MIMAADKKAPAKGKAPVKKKSYKYSANYEVSGTSVKRKKKSCPKCGAGVFLAEHKDRRTCGKCSYMERVK
jgi:small subunit ribosomal protein S27Ae